MDTEFGMQELYFVQLKSTYPMEINGKQIAAGETIAAFDKIQLANFQEINREVAAQGGYEGRKLVVWTQTKGVDLTFTQGIFSQVQFGLMNNVGLLKIDDSYKLRIAQRDELETNDQGIIELSYEPADNWIFVYNKETGEKLTDLQRISAMEIQTPLVYTDVIVDYNYEYDNGATASIVGAELLEGYVSLEGRSRVKDDVTGMVRTAIIKIPRLKITSNFNLLLGANASPMVGKFTGTAIPIERGYDKEILEIYFLEDDIDKDNEWR